MDIIMDLDPPIDNNGYDIRIWRIEKGGVLQLCFHDGLWMFMADNNYSGYYLLRLVVAN